MKTKLVSALCLALAACEGEPPLTPPVTPTSGGVTPAAADSDTSQATAQDTARPATTCNPCQCCPCCQCGAAASSGDAGAITVAAGDGGAPAAEAPAHGDVVGTIVTTPAYLASVSVAFIEDAPIVPGRGMHARIDNRQMTFSPMVQVIAVGGSVAFDNTDPFPHNVFSPDGKFNLGTIPQHSASAPRRFEKPGEFTLLCNLHPGMIGYLVVAPSSYFAKADGKGHFRITDVPNGTYKITAWAPRLSVVTQTVTVNGGEAKTDFELHR